MLSEIIAPTRLRDGDPQALAALVAVAGWPVLAYCDRAGAGQEAARAVVLAFVTFRRRAIAAGDDAAGELEQILLASARDAVDEVLGDAPPADAARAAGDAFARSSPRPLSPRLATQLLHALVDAAPVAGDPSQVRAAAERSYAEAYAAAEPAPAVPGEQRLAPASAVLLQAAGAHAEPPAAEPSPAPPLIARLRGLPPVWRAAAFGAAIALLLLVMVLLPGGDEQPAEPATATVARTVTVTVPGAATRTTAAAPRARAQVIRRRPRAPFTASGARFEVVPTDDASWAQEIRADEPRTGSRWVTVAVRTRNVDRRDLVLRSLGYRLRSGVGAILGPRALDVAEAPARAREGRMPAGARASVHLAFEVPFETRTLALLFEPGGLDGPTVLVALGDVR